MIAIEILTAISPLPANKYTKRNADANFAKIATTTENPTTIRVGDGNENHLRNSTTKNKKEKVKDTALGNSNRPRSGAGPPPPKTGVVKGRLNLGWQFLQLKCK